MTTRAPPLPSWLAAGLLLASGTAAQRPAIDSFGIGDGLPSALVYDLAQDASGRLWILSRSGLTVYDGRRFVTHGPAEGLTTSFLGALTVDASGRAWTVTGETRQVYFLLDGRWHGLPDFPGIGADGDRASALAVLTGPGAAVEVVVGTSKGGLWLWRGVPGEEGSPWAQVSTGEGLPSVTVNDLEPAEAAGGGARVAVATAHGFCWLEAGRLDCPGERDPWLAESILALSSAGPAESPLWVLASTWMGSILDGEIEARVLGLSLKVYDTGITGAVEEDRAGGIYFSSPGTLYFVDPADGRVVALGQNEGLPNEGATAILSDREGNVWIGGLRGLGRIGSRRFLSFDRASGLLEDEVSAVAETSPGRFVFGHNTGLTFFNGERFDTVEFGLPPSGQLSAWRVLDLEVDKKGRLWVAALSKGLLEFHPPDRSFTVHLPGTEVFAVEADDRGRLWVLARHAIYVLRDGGELDSVGLETSDAKVFMRWLTIDANRLFVATRLGLLWRRLDADPHDRDAWRKARGEDVVADNVYGALVRPSGEVWAATQAGLRRLDGGRLAALDGGADPGRPVYFLAADPGGRTWLGTDDGVYVWDGKRLRQLTVRHGLAGRETNRGGALVDHRGRLWVGTVQGVSVYQEGYDVGPAVAPRAVLERVEVAGELRSPDEDLVLAPHQGALNFHVGAVALSPEEEVLCRYRLDGFDDAWQGPERPPEGGIRYPPLPPGSYRFRVAAGWGDGGAWGQEVASAAILVPRPLWRRPWFLGLVAFAVAASVLTVHRLRLGSIRRRTQELEAWNVRLEEAAAEREELIAELETKNAELERYTYSVSHDLKSPLVTVRGFIGHLERDVAKGDAQAVRRDLLHIREAAGNMGVLLDNLLELSRIGRVIHPPQKVELRELVEEALQALAGTLTQRGVEVEVGEGLPRAEVDRVRVVEVFQNLIENAVKYMGGQASPRIEVGVRRADGKEVITVRDNGEGIDPQYHDKVFGLFERLHHDSEGTGVGLALVRRIVEVHGGRIWIESEGEGKGATFCFTLPGGSLRGSDQ